MRLHSRVRTTNFLSEAQTQSGLGTLDCQHVILPLNVTLAIRSHLPRRWETVFRWTMKAIIGPRRSGEPVYSKQEKTWWNPCVLMILMSASRDQPQTSFSTRAPWRFAFDHKSINSSEHALRSSSLCAQLPPADALFCPSTDKGGGWLDGWMGIWVGSTTSERMLQPPRSGISFSLRKKEILLQTVETHGLPFQHAPALQTKVFTNILPSDSEFTHSRSTKPEYGFY